MPKKTNIEPVEFNFLDWKFISTQGSKLHENELD
jgi:hypothetical protein